MVGEVERVKDHERRFVGWWVERGAGFSAIRCRRAAERGDRRYLCGAGGASGELTL